MDNTQVTGRFSDGVTWFYCSPETGYMMTGWFQDGGTTWYYCYTSDDAELSGKREGEMAANTWVYYNEKWYYLNESGGMETNKWVRVSNSDAWSWVGPDGAWMYDA